VTAPDFTTGRSGANHLRAVRAAGDCWWESTGISPARVPSTVAWGKGPDKTVTPGEPRVARPGAAVTLPGTPLSSIRVGGVASESTQPRHLPQPQHPDQGRRSHSCPVLHIRAAVRPERCGSGVERSDIVCDAVGALELCREGEPIAQRGGRGLPSRVFPVSGDPDDALGWRLVANTRFRRPAPPGSPAIGEVSCAARTLSSSPTPLTVYPPPSALHVASRAGHGCRVSVRWGGMAA
jgi:hypothetical protein